MGNDKIIIMIITDDLKQINDISNCINKDKTIVKLYKYDENSIKAIKDTKPDIVFIDMLNNEKAYNLLKDIRIKVPFKNIKIIVGVDTDIYEIQKYIKAGADEYVIKPYIREIVEVRINNLVEIIKNKKEAIIREIQFQTLLNNIPYMAWFKDVDSKYIIVNNEFIEHSGKPHNVIAGRDDFFVWDGKIGGLCRLYDLEVMNKKKRVVFDEIIPGVKGYKEFNIYKAPVIDDKDNVIGTIGIAKDITELKNKDAKLEMILENIPYGVWLKDVHGVFLQVNSAYVEFIGLDKEDIIGKNIEDIFKKDEVSVKISDEYVKNNKKSLVYSRCVSINGQKKELEINKSPVFDISNEVIGIVGMFKDITESVRIQEEIRRHAYTDTLTELGNRRALYEYMDDKISRRDISIIVMLIDVDNFKGVNDNWGHGYGDEILKLIANKIKKNCNSSLISRMGGDEFVLIWENLTLDDVKKKASRLLYEMKLEFSKNDKLNMISISMGIATDDNNDIDKLLIKSDFALYKAKEKGKNQFVFYDDSLNQERELKFRIENDFIKAIENKEIVLYYQPLYTCDGVIRGFEALFRWDNDKYKSIPVIKIIEIIEKGKLIEVVGEYIFREACKFAKSINEHSKKIVTVSVNISAIQIMNENFVEKLINIIKEVDILPQYMGIEITETVLLNNMDINIEKIRTLRELGILVSLDDFGTGYSSFSYLVKLPISEVKIDKSFITGMNFAQEYKTLVRLIVDAAHTLNLPVVAEGVEEVREFEYLKSINVDYIQGYIFSKPLCREDAEKLIKIKEK